MGVAWYINDSLIPELIVTRGRTYTFLVEGGRDFNDLHNYHPFYITNSSSGGRLLNAPDQQKVRKEIYVGKLWKRQQFTSISSNLS